MARSENGESASTYAAEKGDEASLRLLIDAEAAAGADPSFLDDAARGAAMRGHIPCLLIAIAAGANIHAQDGRSAAMLAAACGRLEVLGMLLDMGVDIDAQCEMSGYTCALYASFGGEDECLRLLIERGANLSLKAMTGCSPINRACSDGRDQCLSLLIEAGCDVNDENSHGETCAMLAAAHSDGAACLAMLAHAGADLLRVGPKWKTALMAAAHKGSLESLTMLWSRGGDMFARDDEGQSALDYAKSRDPGPIAEFAMVIEERTALASQTAIATRSDRIARM